MTATLRGRIAVPAVLAPLVLVLAACGGSSSGGDADAGSANAACPSNMTATASTPLPSDVPTPAGATSPYDYFPQGATKVWYFAIDGSPSDLASMRDTYDNTLTAKGYTIEGTDQEENAEAESEFSGPHAGTTNFRPLCTGKVVFRLKTTS
jgi:Flp pilus assembly protein TadD